MHIAHSDNEHRIVDIAKGTRVPLFQAEQITKRQKKKEERK